MRIQYAKQGEQGDVSLSRMQRERRGSSRMKTIMTHETDASFASTVARHTNLAKKNEMNDSIAEAVRDIDIARTVVRCRWEDRGDLTNDFLHGFEEGMAEFIAAKYKLAAADVLEMMKT